MIWRPPWTDDEPPALPKFNESPRFDVSPNFDVPPSLDELHAMAESCFTRAMGHIYWDQISSYFLNSTSFIGYHLDSNHFEGDSVERNVEYKAKGDPNCNCYW